ncbi:MAG: poly-beta,6-N-acetyl-D-glucosamine synthase, partial [Pseudomonadota bacterium]|nr:poly-beta,6-N-acetyl-D-glucosamine synthase [Pseudomonadota bacterium]
FFVIIPGLILMFYGYELIFGPYLLFLVFTSMINNYIFYMGQKKLFKSFGYYLKLNPLTFITYSIFYQYLMNLPVIFGYYLEFFKRKKFWGTK